MGERYTLENATEWWGLAKLVRLSSLTIGKQGEVGPQNSISTVTDLSVQEEGDGSPRYHYNYVGLCPR